LVLAVERSAQEVVKWSLWRRWHQAWARWHHYRTRARDTAVKTKNREEQASKEEQSLDVEAAWKRLEGWMAGRRGSGRRPSHERRSMFDAIVYVMQRDCGWQGLPSQYPPWKAVYAQYSAWRKAGIWDVIWAEPAQRFACDELQL
jgi:hypothetical protein